MQKQQKQFQQLEEKIALLNKEQETLQHLLAAPETYADRNKFQETESRLKSVNQELKQLNLEYEKAFEKLMELEDKVGGN